MQTGYTEVTYARSEKIGLPNWSFVTLMASVKTTTPTGSYDDTYNFLSLVVETFLKERVEAVARSLNLWAGIETTTLDPGTKQGILPIGLTLSGTEVSFTMKETVGLPEKSSLDIFASSKSAADMGAELASLEAVALLVIDQMKNKRDVVLANPRPWTAQR